MSTPEEKQKYMEEIEEALAAIRGGLALHRGGVELVDADMETGVVSVRMLGMCVGCGFADMTVKDLIEDTLVNTVEGVREVVAVA